MKVEMKFYFKAAIYDEATGEMATFGVCADLGEVDWRAEEPFDYQKCGNMINKERLLENLCLDKFVTPENFTLITKEEYDNLVGDEVEDEEDE